MTTEKLSGEELAALVRSVFSPGPGDRALAILVDLPDEEVPDTPAWQQRRELALGWWEALRARRERTGLEPSLCLLRNARMQNAELPPTAHLHPGGELPASADALDPAAGEPLRAILRRHSIVLAPTQFSATAPLKLAARELGTFRAATMPGFCAAMIPALRLDYTEINRRCCRMKELLDPAEQATFRFRVEGEGEGEGKGEGEGEGKGEGEGRGGEGEGRGGEHELLLDLRQRTATVSGGVFPDNGVAGNLPSGETYIVPLEGEASRSAGELPVQHGDEVVVYRVERNRALEVLGGAGPAGPAAEAEARRLAREPAYGNLAELGLGVLGDFGLDPIGELLLDEKLGPHIAFGRSDHFGGQVGAADFSSPSEVVHIDHVYLRSMQPRIRVREVTLSGADGVVTLLRDDRYVIDF